MLVTFVLSSQIGKGETMFAPSFTSWSCPLDEPLGILDSDENPMRIAERTSGKRASSAIA